MRNLFEFFLMTGLGRGELCWLTKEDVELGDKRFIRIRAKTCPTTGVVGLSQAGEGRIVPLVAEAADIAMMSMRLAAGPWVFWSPLSRPPRRGQYRPGALLTALHKAREAAGVKPGTIHTFRHVFCAFAANRQISPFKVMKILGHGSLKIILRYYHLDADELFDCVQDLPFNVSSSIPAGPRRSGWCK